MDFALVMKDFLGSIVQKKNALVDAIQKEFAKEENAIVLKDGVEKIATSPYAKSNVLTMDIVLRLENVFVRKVGKENTVTRES